MKTKNILFIILSIICFSFLFVFIFLNFNRKSISYQMNKEYKAEANRYSEIFKADENDVLRYMRNKVDYDFLPMTVMDEMFETCGPKFSDLGQDELFSIYYANWANLAEMYRENFENPRFKYLLSQFISTLDENKKDSINDSTVYSTIPNISLRTMVEELHQNHLKIIVNGDFFEVYLDFQWFYDEYSKIMNDELISFVNLNILSNREVVSELRASIKLDYLEEIILNYTDFLDNSTSVILRYNAVQVLRTAIRCYLCSDYTYVLYENLTEYSYPDNLINHYNNFINQYNESSFVPLLQNTLNLIEKEGGKGNPLDTKVAKLVDEWLLDNGYVSSYELEEISALNDLNEYFFSEESN